MATINIGGQRVTIDDAFLSLSPEEQDATVDEIAQSLGLGGNPELPEASPDMPVGMQVRPGPGMSPDEMQAGMSEMSDMTQALGAGRSAMDPEDYDRGLRATMEARKMLGESAMPRGGVQYMGQDGSLGDVVPQGGDRGGAGQGIGDFVDRAMMDSIPFTDEAYSATIGNVGRMMRDGIGPVEAYKREHALQEEISKRRYERSPVASTAGMLAGSLATGGAVLKAGNVIPGMARLGNTARLAAFGGATGLGQGEGTDRLKNAAIGAVAAPVVGGILNKTGQVVSKALAPKAAPALPASRVLADEASGVYKAAYESGTVITKKGATRLVDNMKLAAGRPNVNSRPKTFGLLDDLAAMRNKPMDIEAFHELRKQVNAAISRADPEDARTLSRMKDVLDGSEKWMGTADVANGKQGLDLLKKANEIYGRSARTGKIEQLSELAKLKSGNFTQAGEARAISQQAQRLATEIIKDGSQGFKPAEVELINKIAMGETSGKVSRYFAKYAPRSVVSAGIGSGVGSTAGATVGAALGGPAVAVVGGAIGGVTPGAIGHVAAKKVDKAAIAAIRQLEEMVASGKASPALKKIAPKMLGYTPGITTGTIKLLPTGSEQRR